MKLNWNFLKYRVHQTKTKTFSGRGMEIFWENSLYFSYALILACLFCTKWSVVFRYKSGKNKWFFQKLRF